MNTIITSRDEILKNSSKLIQQQGWIAVNIRSVAKACGISVGSVYNYFGSKEELVNATVESIWHEIFHLPQETTAFHDTQAYICWMYERMEYGCKKYPGFFTLHSFRFTDQEKSDGKRLMYQTWDHLTDSLCSVLKHDPDIRSNAFNEQFTLENFANVLFSLMLSAMLHQDYDPSVVLEMIRRILY